MSGIKRPANTELVRYKIKLRRIEDPNRENPKVENPKIENDKIDYFQYLPPEVKYVILDFTELCYLDSITISKQWYNLCNEYSSDKTKLFWPTINSVLQLYKLVTAYPKLQSLNIRHLSKETAIELIGNKHIWKNLRKLTVPNKLLIPMIKLSPKITKLTTYGRISISYIKYFTNLEKLELKKFSTDIHDHSNTTRFPTTLRELHINMRRGNDCLKHILKNCTQIEKLVIKDKHEYCSFCVKYYGLMPNLRHLELHNFTNDTSHILGESLLPLPKIETLIIIGISKFYFEKDILNMPTIKNITISQFVYDYNVATENPCIDKIKKYIKN